MRACTGTLGSMKAKKPRPAGFRVTPDEKAELLAAQADARRGGSLPFDEGMAEVRGMTDAILGVGENAPAPEKVVSSTTNSTTPIAAW